MDFIEKKYHYFCNEGSDIHEHLPNLFKYAKECDSIIECGVRSVISSWALLYGLSYNNKPIKQLLLNDIKPCNITELLDAGSHTNVEINYQWINDLEMNLTQNYDLIFIDTWHVYGHLKRELNKFSPYINKYIVMHDTTVDEFEGETIREKLNAYEQSQTSGIPIEEILCGLGKAIDEFLQENDNWVLHEKLTYNNGLTVLRRVDK
jgi:hypothetical protein